MNTPRRPHRRRTPPADARPGGPGLRDAPLPRVTTTTGPTLPGWLFPLAQTLTAAPLLATAAPTTWLDHGLFLTTLAALTALVLLRPTAGTAGLLLTTTGALLWISGDGPLDPRALWLAPTGYLLWRATWWAAHVPPTARVETAAALAGWRRAVVVLGATELLAVAAWAVTTLPGAGAAILVGALALAALTFLALPRDAGGAPVRGPG
ncbi:hypothetical protein [Myceligenerans pegani]|uniref:Integral membrane protein n=1 Tax=Myceligenerans pegani TaxID=2776917 RepID=A0ABR9MU54_9MICO|nr:hypothetical protein [Myceligenerans sp. TRM 65318]MBE1874910.1 hypothetical protein [Myceligenerans sp. TRM 65318]MBE3017181.1 hypothetical protein [Myceligenerans sp. TRM 65318]